MPVKFNVISTLAHFKSYTPIKHYQLDDRATNGATVKDKRKHNKRQRIPSETSIGTLAAVEGGASDLSYIILCL